MTRDRVVRTARALTLAAIALATVYLTVSALLQMGDTQVLERTFQLVGLWYLVPGAIVVLRRDGHVIGWLLVVSGLLWSVQLSTEVPGAGLAWMALPWQAWLNSWAPYAQWTSTIALFVLFPDGLADRTPRQQRTGRAIVATAVAATAVGAVSTQVTHPAVTRLFDNPTGLGLVPLQVTEYLIVPIGLGGIAAVAGAWRRARLATGPARQQYRWVLFSFVVIITGLAFGLGFGEVLGDNAWLLIVAGWFLIPTAFSVAILRHRLYDIDRIVSRTVAYAVITAVVAGIYVVPVVVLPALFDLRGPLPVAVATLAAAAAFSPVRRVVQRWVDRRFNREAFDARRELDVFAGRLRSAVELDAVTADIRTLVDTTLQPTATALWVRPARPSQ